MLDFKENKSCILTIYHRKERNKKYGKCKIIQKNDKCYDIDVKPGTTVVIFDVPNIELKGINKVFPDVTTLILNQNVVSVDISNRMFPNVRNIKSFSPLFMNNSKLICKFRHKKITLYNTFCLNTNEVLNLADITDIANYAMDGCLTKDVVNVNSLERCAEFAFAGSIFEKEPLIFDDKVVNYITEDLNIIDLSTVRCIRDKLDMTLLQGILVQNEKDLYWLTNYAYNSNQTFDNLYIEAYVLKNLKWWKNICRDIPCLNVHVIHGNAYFSDDGIIYKTIKNDRILCFCPPSRQKQVNIPDGITMIGSDAFCRCKLSSVLCPESLTMIEQYAFANSKIQEVHLGCNVDFIGSYAFSGCDQLVDINLKDTNLKHVGIYAFKDCFRLQTIELPDSINQIGKGAFISTKEINVQNLNNLILEAIINDLDKKEAYTKVICMGKTFYIPAFMTHNTISSLDLSQEDGELLYNQANDVRCKQETAIAVYKETGNQKVCNYLKRAVLSISRRFLDENRESDFVDFIKILQPSKSTLQKLLKTVENMDFVIAKSYLLDALKDDRKNSFTL